MMRSKVMTAAGVAMVVLFGIGVVAHAIGHIPDFVAVYYYESGQKVVIMTRDIDSMTVPQIEGLCEKLIKTAQDIKKADPTGGIALSDYVHAQRSGLDWISLWPLFKDQEMPALSPVDMEDAVKKVQAVVAHNQAAARGRAAVKRAQQRLLDLL